MHAYNAETCSRLAVPRSISAPSPEPERSKSTITQVHIPLRTKHCMLTIIATRLGMLAPTPAPQKVKQGRELRAKSAVHHPNPAARARPTRARASSNPKLRSLTGHRTVGARAAAPAAQHGHTK